jgi:hypothetical protein
MWWIGAAAGTATPWQQLVQQEVANINMGTSDGQQHTQEQAQCTEMASSTVHEACRSNIIAGSGTA